MVRGITPVEVSEVSRLVEKIIGTMVHSLYTGMVKYVLG